MDDLAFKLKQHFLSVRCEVEEKFFEGRKKELINALETISKHCCCGYSLFLADLVDDTGNHPFAAVWGLHTAGVEILTETGKHLNDEVIAAGFILREFVDKAHLVVKKFRDREEMLLAGKKHPEGSIFPLTK